MFRVEEEFHARSQVTLAINKNMGLLAIGERPQQYTRAGFRGGRKQHFGPRKCILCQIYQCSLRGKHSGAVTSTSVLLVSVLWII